MQKPPSVAIREQVSAEVAEHLPDQVSGLFVGTVTSQQSTKITNETGQNLDQEFADEISVLAETGEVDTS